MNQLMSLFGLLALGCALFGCSSNETKNNSQQIYSVKVVNASGKLSNTQFQYVGVVEEESAVSVSFPISGTVEYMYASQGQRVSKGAKLAQLNTATLQAAYQATKAQAEQAEDAMSRIQMMYDNQSIAEIKYIDTKTQVEKAKSMVVIAKKNLDNSYLVAPIGGIIGRKSVDVGENVLPNQSVYTILQIEHQVKVKISVPEKEIGELLENQPASFTVPSLNNAKYCGKISEKGILADPMSHSYDIRVIVDNKDMKLLPGMICEVTLDRAGTTKQLSIPNRSVQKYSDGATYVWINDGGVAIKRTVKVGKLTRYGVEITDGLNGNESVISDGYQNLFEGAKIRIVE